MGPDQDCKRRRLVALAPILAAACSDPVALPDCPPRYSERVLIDETLLDGNAPSGTYVIDNASSGSLVLRQSDITVEISVPQLAEVGPSLPPPGTEVVWALRSEDTILVSMHDAKTGQLVFLAGDVGPPALFQTPVSYSEGSNDPTCETEKVAYAPTHVLVETDTGPISVPDDELADVTINGATYVAWTVFAYFRERNPNSVHPEAGRRTAVVVLAPKS